jgi:glycosyltransferase involved in cell wall biosynthesis
VIVPTRNGERWIRDQLAALSRQSYGGEWELIIADSGSTDDTRAVATRWSHRFPAFRVLDATGGRGPARGRNQGALAASSDVVLFTDVDDIVNPNWIAQLTNGLRTAPIVTGPIAHFVDGRAPSWETVQRFRERPPPGPFEPLIGCNMGIERNLLLELGGFDETAPSGWDDTDLGVRATHRGISTAWVDDAVVLRRRPRSAWAMWRKELAYGRGWTMLERRYPELAPDGWVRPLLSRAGWVAVRAPYLAFPSRRRAWLARAAGLTGRLAERLRPSL